MPFSCKSKSSGESGPCRGVRRAIVHPYEPSKYFGDACEAHFPTWAEAGWKHKNSYFLDACLAATQTSGSTSASQVQEQ